MIPRLLLLTPCFITKNKSLLGPGQVQSPTGQPTNGACTNSAWPTQCVQVEKMDSNTILSELTGT